MSAARLGYGIAETADQSLPFGALYIRDEGACCSAVLEYHRLLFDGCVELLRHQPVGTFDGLTGAADLRIGNKA